MNIKEACRYHNHLSILIESLSLYLRNTNNAVKSKEVHSRSKSNPEATDETIEVKPERQFGENCSVVDIAYLINQIIIEKLNLSNAISTAKEKLTFTAASFNFNIDSAVEHAKKSRELAFIIKPLVNLKSKEERTTGRGLKFNAEGNQVSYMYDLDKVITIDFDRNNLNALYKKLLEQADILSNLVEENMLKNIMDFIPGYPIHESVDEVVEKYLSSK